MKKALTISAIASMGLVIAMLIGGVFSLPVFTNPYLKILLTSCAISVGSAFSINCLNLYEKKKAISLVSLALILISIVLLLILIWGVSFANESIFVRLTIIFAITSVFFNVVVSLNVKSYKKYIALQIITYILLLFIDLAISLLLFEVNLLEIEGFGQIFIVACLITVALLITLSILGKKNHSLSQDLSSKEKGFMKIKVEEYQAMKNRIAELEEKLK